MNTLQKWRGFYLTKTLYSI